MSEKEDFENILLENGDIYYVTRQTTTEDSIGDVKKITDTTFRIFCIFQDITLKDRKIHEMGLAVAGNRKVYIMPDYSITSGGVSTINEVKINDIITDTKLYSGTNTGKWRVVKILKQWYEPAGEIYRVAIVKSINLDGTK